MRRHYSHYIVYIIIHRDGWHSIDEMGRGVLMTVLKPCPFCGRPVIVFVSIQGVHGASDYYAIAHPDGTDCIVDGMQTSSYEDKDELIRDWNRRVKE